MYCRAALRPKTRASSTSASAGEGYSGRLPLSLPPVRGEPGGSGEGCLLEERRRAMPDDPGFALEGEALLADCRERREPVQLCKREGVPARDVRALRRGALCNYKRVLARMSSGPVGGLAVPMKGYARKGGEDRHRKLHPYPLPLPRSDTRGWPQRSDVAPTGLTAQ